MRLDNMQNIQVLDFLSLVKTYCQQLNILISYKKMDERIL